LPIDHWPWENMPELGDILIDRRIEIDSKHLDTGYRSEITFLNTQTSS
jgi:hypothetical protein